MKKETRKAATQRPITGTEQSTKATNHETRDNKAMPVRPAPAIKGRFLRRLKITLVAVVVTGLAAASLYLAWQERSALQTLLSMPPQKDDNDSRHVLEELQLQLENLRVALAESSAKLENIARQFDALEAQTAVIANRQLEPLNAIALIRNHLSMIEQQLYFDYDKNRIDRQLEAVERLMFDTDSARLATAIIEVRNFRKTLAAHPVTNVEPLVDEIDAFVRELKHSPPPQRPVPERRDLKQQSFLDALSARFDSIIVVRRQHDAGTFEAFDLDMRRRWIALNFEMLKLRLWAHDWQAVNAQAKNFSQWLRSNQPYLHSRFQSLLNRLQVVDPPAFNHSLHAVHKALLSLE